MKLRTKIVLITLIPMVLLTVLAMVMAQKSVRTLVMDEAYKGMDATAVSIREIFVNASDGEFRMDENGDMWKGDDMNISQSNEIVDQIKTNTGFEVTVFYGDTRCLTSLVDESGARMVGTKASDAVVAAVLTNGNTFQSDDVEILGKRYVCYYIPIYQEGTNTPIGMVFLGEEYSKITSAVMDAMNSIGTPIFVVALVSIGVAIFLGKKITDAITESISYLGILADGKLGIKISDKLLNRKDIIGDMCRAIASLNDKLTDMIIEIKKQCETLTANSNKCNKTADGLESSIEQISAVVQEVAATTTSQAQDAENANFTIESMGDLIEKISNEADQAMDAINVLDKSMNQVESSVGKISKETNETYNSVEKINEAAALISSISLQTNLLSLNASIEAARAGQYGKGFAVVANEISQLAGESDESSKQIQEILDELRTNSENSLKGMAEVRDTVAIQKDNLQKTEELFKSLQTRIGGAKSSAITIDLDEITEKVASLNTEREKTITAVHDLAAASEEIAASMEQTAASVEEVADMSASMGEQATEMKSIADILEDRLSQFVIEG